MKSYHHFLRIVFLIVLGGSMPWTNAADALKPASPSIAVIDLSGKVAANGHCELKCEYDIGKEGKPVRMDAFCAVRYSEDGDTNSFELKPEPKAETAGEPEHFTFTWTDTEVQEGKTYYYYLTYTADVRLATSPIVLTVPEKGSEKAKKVEDAPLAVEVFGPDQMGVPNVFIARAHANKPGATFSWRPADERIGEVCAQREDTALLRVKDVPGFGHCAWIVEARLNDEQAQSLYMPGMIKLSWIPVATPSAKDIEEAKKGTDIGKKLVRDQLRSTFKADSNDAMSRHVTSHFLLTVGTPALSEIQAYYEESEDAGVRYELLNLMAAIDEPFAFDHYFDRVLKERDLPQVAHLIGLTVKLAKNDPDNILKKLRPLLADSMPSLRYSAIGALGEIGSELAVPDLKRVRDSDPLGTLRFAAARALVAIKTKTYPPKPKPPNWRPRAPLPADVEKAQALFPEVLKQVTVPGATNDTLLAKDSPLVKFCILCDATVPVITDWLYQGVSTDEELERVKWAFNLTGAGLPPDIKDTYAERVLSKEGQAQQEELKHYRSFLQNWTEYDWDRMNAILDDENPRELSIGHRLEILAWFAPSIRSEMASSGTDKWLETATKWQDNWFQFAQLGYTPGCDRLVARCTDGSIRVWDADTLEECWVGQHANMQDYFSCENKGFLTARITSADGKSTTKLWRIRDGQTSIHPEGSLSADGRYFAYGEEKTVHVLDAATGTEMKVLLLKGPFSAIQFDTAGTCLFTSDNDGQVLKWNLKDFSMSEMIVNVTPWNLCESEKYTVIEEQGGLGVFDLSVNKKLFKIDLTSEMQFNGIAPDGSSVTVVEDGGQVRQFALPSGKLTWSVWNDGYYGPTYTEDAKWIILGGNNGTAVLEAATGKTRFHDTTPNYIRKGATIIRLKDGSLLAIADRSPLVRILDAQSLKPISDYKKIVGFEWSGNLFDCDTLRDRLAYTANGVLTICEARTGNVIRHLPQKPKFPRHPSSYNSIEQPLEILLRLQEVDDQVGKMARDMFPETKALLQNRPQRPKPIVRPATSKKEEGF